MLLVSLLETTVLFHVVPNLLSGNTFTSHFVVYAAINFFLFWSYHLIIYPFVLSPFRHLPMLSGWYPFVGHGMVLFTRPPGQRYLEMMKATPNDGLIHTHSFLHTDRLLLTSPAAIADVLVSRSYDWEKAPWMRSFLRMFLGDGLLVSEGDSHKFQRKQIKPAFNFRNIKELYPVFWNKSLELCAVITEELRKKEDQVLEFNHFTTQVTLDIIGLAGMGRDINSMRNADDELIESYEELLEPTHEKAAYFVLHLILPPWLVGSLPWKLNERVRIITTRIKRICRDFVQDKKSKLKTEGKESSDILSILLRSNNFSDNDLVDQLLTFLAAGHETTSSALTWTSHLLAIHPTMQTRLRKEIYAAIPNPSSIDPDNLSTTLESLPYLNAICNETLRLYPTIPTSARYAIRPTTICNQPIPSGTLVFVIPWAINRDPSVWGPDAESFVPERWIDSETGKVNYSGGVESNYSFLTFFHGPRSCIGEKFARAELRAMVAALVGSFELEMADPNEIVRAGGTITSKPVNGMNLRMKVLEWGG